MASAKHDDCLIANDNPDLWFLVTLLLLVRNDFIQLVEDDTPASRGLLRTGANFFKTLNRQNKFLKTNKYSLKRANEFRFFCCTISIVFAWKSYRNNFVLKNPCWLILKPCKFVIPKWKQGSLKYLDNEEKSECSQVVKLKLKLICFTFLVGSLWNCPV